MNANERSLAKCLNDGIPPSMFFEGFEFLSLREKYVAASVCAGCLVRDVCLSSAKEREEIYGLWGGVFFKKGREVSFESISLRPYNKKLIPMKVDIEWSDNWGEGIQLFPRIWD